MAFEKARDYLKNMGYEDRIRTFEVSSATVELAAIAVGTKPERIAKSLTFKVNDKPIMVICAGDGKVSNSKYKNQFGVKARMLSPDEVHELIGHDIGGVCPFGINDGVDVYLDETLKRFDIVYPACGSGNSAVELSIEDLEKTSNFISWVDVCDIKTKENQ